MQDETLTISATTASGREFDDWSGGYSGSVNPGSVTMDGHKSITAHFVQATHTLSVATTGQGSVSPASGTYTEGTQVSIAPTPATGWSFKEWTGDLNGTSNPGTVTMNADKSITAVFVPLYGLQTATEGEGRVEPEAGIYPEGTQVSVTAIPETDGGLLVPDWVFHHWTGDLSGSDNPATVTMDESKSVTAVFYPQYYLVVSVEGEGTVSPEMGTYVQGTTVTVTPSPASGWVFDHWSGGTSGSANPASITMIGHKLITAVFVQEFALTVETDGQGTVEVSPENGPYDSGTTVTLTPTPATDWVFDHWEGDLTGNSDPGTLTMDGDKTVTAVFVQGFSLTSNTSGQGTLEVLPAEGPYTSGSVVTLTPTAEVDWVFDHWEGDLTGEADPGELTMDSDKTVTGVFVELTVKIRDVEVTEDRIEVLLGPTGVIGTLVLTLTGPGGPHEILSASREAGQHVESFGLANLPVAEFTGITAEWTVDNVEYSDDKDYHFENLGMFRHSRYNIPDEAEATCQGDGTMAPPVYMTDDCQWVQATLHALFLERLLLNGSGTTIEHGLVTRSTYDYDHCEGRPVDAVRNRTFRIMEQAMGSCGAAVDGTTVARHFQSEILHCNDRVLIVGLGGGVGTVKTVRDSGDFTDSPNDGFDEEHQLDNFDLDVVHCGASIVDLGNFQTIKLY
ncbi:MAG: hypothetical protein HYV27_15435 [Candidatus Hydrogenedentes bacterium]|nr:hypothetical protein [Candidatus Hydrogenedentota bacterium]